MGKKLTNDDIIARTRQVYGDAYTIPPDLKYIGDKHPYQIICNTCKKVITIKRFSHFWAQKDGCKTCRSKNFKYHKNSNDKFIAESKQKFVGKFLYPHTHYVNSKTPVIITCKKHGDFSINIDTFFRSKHGGCKQCIREAIDLGIKLQLQLLKEENNLKSINDLFSL